LIGSEHQKPQKKLLAAFNKTLKAFGNKKAATIAAFISLSKSASF
jgi:hypothetical protein